jgi:hypothetical protein
MMARQHQQITTAKQNIALDMVTLNLSLNCGMSLLVVVNRQVRLCYTMMNVVALLLMAGVTWRQSSARCCSIGTRGCDQAADG